MSLRLLLDENSSEHRLTSMLRAAGHDVVWLQDLALYGTRDDDVLLIAHEKKRVLYTRDRDFLGLSKNIKSHSGIIFEYRMNRAGDMTRHQIIKAFATIEKQFSSLTNQILILNSFGTRV